MTDLRPNALFSLRGKTALVTGGASGIGRMAAEGMVQAGARVLLASRKGDACQAAAEEINVANPDGSAVGFSGDIGSVEGISKLADEVRSRTDRLDILMNNAGVTWGAPLEDFPYDAWENIMAVNVAGPFELTRQLLPMLKASASADDPARVVNVGSVMGEIPLGDGAYSYAASKSAVIHITRILAKELASDHITANALAPGPFVSRMTAFATADPDARERVGKSVPLGRVGRDDDIAAAMQFLCGRGGAYVTGAIIPISGGINVMSGHDIFAAAFE